jgi:hypothetical protein
MQRPWVTSEASSILIAPPAIGPSVMRVVAFDCGSVRIDRGSLDRLRLIGFAVPDEAHKRREAFFPEWASRMKPDCFARHFVGQFEATACKIFFSDGAARIAAFGPYRQGGMFARAVSGLQRLRAAFARALPSI